MNQDLLGRLKREPTCDVEDAARVYGIFRGAAYNAVNAGSIPSIRIGHRLRVLTRPMLAQLGLTSPDQD